LKNEDNGRYADPNNSSSVRAMSVNTSDSYSCSFKTQDATVSSWVHVG